MNSNSVALESGTLLDETSEDDSFRPQLLGER